MTKQRLSGTIKTMLLAGLVNCIFVSFVYAASDEQRGAIIVHPENIANFTKTEIRKIFLGQLNYYDNNIRILPMLSFEHLELRTRFNETIINKSNRQMRAYWAKQVFTGKGKPPAELKDSELVENVSQNQSAIGLVPIDAIDNKKVRVILEF